ncbi:MAG TPA: hypothetical protein VMS71_06910 [Candidatus Acidoferrum sp.]|nr:hypothetical protein [Candidatus Acidoferrum sp.]
MIDLTARQIVAFQRKILRFYKLYGRDLPFRRTTDPYRITVAESMLQQTQVDRVVPKYEAWIRRWPTWQALARSNRRQLLTMWSGLGYNRRCLYLGELANIVVTQYLGKLPDDPALLQKLPGLGPYTSNAILIFAFNRPLITIDTNIRRVLMHEFRLPASTSKAELEILARRLLPRGRSRDWHNALMDYSVLRLPRKLPSVPPQSRQSRFLGSVRQIRGEIIRRLTRSNKLDIEALSREMKRSEADVCNAALALQKEGTIRISGKIIRLA